MSLEAYREVNGAYMSESEQARRVATEAEDLIDNIKDDLVTLE